MILFLLLIIFMLIWVYGVVARIRPRVVQIRHPKLWSVISQAGSVESLADRIGRDPQTVHSWCNLIDYPISLRQQGFDAELDEKLYRLAGVTTADIWPSQVRRFIDYNRIDAHGRPVQ